MPRSLPLSQSTIKPAHSKTCTAPQTCVNTGGWHTIKNFGEAVASSIYGGLLSADGTTPVYSIVPIADTTWPSAPGITLVSPYNVTYRATRSYAPMPVSIEQSGEGGAVGV